LVLIGDTIVCEPSGLFTNLKAKVDLPLVDTILTSFLQIKGHDNDVHAGVDMYVQFRPSDGLKSVGFRFSANVNGKY
jgi:hypothetical protein